MVDGVTVGSRERSKSKIILDMTLIEGHMKVLIDVDDDLEITDIRIQGIDSRYFEKFCEGFPLDDLPKITPRICGLCSASHHVASAKAVDAVYGVNIPKRAELIRRGITYGIILNNHMLHLTLMGLPDLLLDSNKSMLKLMMKDRELVRLGTLLTKYGHEAVALFGGRDIHPVRAVGGGVAKPPSEKEIREFEEKTKEMEKSLEKFVKLAKKYLDKISDKISSFPNGAEYFAAVTKGSTVDYYEGTLKIVDEKGRTAKEVSAGEYTSAIKEYTFDWTYIKPVTVTWKDYPEGSIKSGPIARINITDKMGTPMADALLEEFREKHGRYVWDPLLYHEARIIESVHTFELIKELLEEPSLLEGDYIVDTSDMVNERGVGLIEAPRGILIHDVKAVQNDEVRIKKLNIITPTAINAAAIEADLRVSFNGKSLKEMDEKELYNMVSSVVRAYDPCMACATHAINKGPSLMLIIRKGNEVLKRIKG